jgi:hypothetical protein
MLTSRTKRLQSNYMDLMHNSKPMRVLAFVNKNSGVSFHRLIMPLLLLDELDVFITNNLLEEHFDKGCDIFYYNRILPDSAVPIIKRLQEKYGFRVIVDIDDYWHLDPHHVLYETYIAEDFARRQQTRSRLRMSDWRSGYGRTIPTCISYQTLFPTQGNSLSSARLATSFAYSGRDRSRTAGISRSLNRRSTASDRCRQRSR